MFYSRSTVIFFPLNNDDSIKFVNGYYLPCTEPTGSGLFWRFEFFMQLNSTQAPPTTSLFKCLLHPSYRYPIEIHYFPMRLQILTKKFQKRDSLRHTGQKLGNRFSFHFPFSQLSKTNLWINSTLNSRRILQMTSRHSQERDNVRTSHAATFILSKLAFKMKMR